MFAETVTLYNLRGRRTPAPCETAIGRFINSPDFVCWPGKESHRGNRLPVVMVCDDVLVESSSRIGALPQFRNPQVLQHSVTPVLAALASGQLEGAVFVSPHPPPNHIAACNRSWALLAELITFFGSSTNVQQRIDNPRQSVTEYLTSEEASAFGVLPLLGIKTQSDFFFSTALGPNFKSEINDKTHPRYAPHLMLALASTNKLDGIMRGHGIAPSANMTGAVLERVRIPYQIGEMYPVPDMPRFYDNRFKKGLEIYNAIVGLSHELATTTGPDFARFFFIEYNLYSLKQASNSTPGQQFTLEGRDVAAILREIRTKYSVRGLGDNLLSDLERLTSQPKPYPHSTGKCPFSRH